MLICRNAEGTMLLPLVTERVGNPWICGWPGSSCNVMFQSSGSALKQRIRSIKNIQFRRNEDQTLLTSCGLIASLQPDDTWSSSCTRSHHTARLLPTKGPVCRERTRRVVRLPPLRQHTWKVFHTPRPPLAANFCDLLTFFLFFFSEFARQLQVFDWRKSRARHCETATLLELT